MTVMPGVANQDAPARASSSSSLRLWALLHACTIRIERSVRTKLRARFAISLARFELLAELGDAPQGLKMSELSRRLMVSGGNVTGLTDQLASEGLVERLAVAGDRRAHVVRLTDRGRHVYASMASEHERLVAELLDDLTERERTDLGALLERVETSVAQREHT
jgi:DNA-binding MarR family transcriptional regulator